MASNVSKARAWGVVAAAAISSLAALFLVFKAVTPEAIGGLWTIEMLGLLALLVLPMSAAWVVRAARSAHASQAPRHSPRTLRVVGEGEAISLRKAA